MKKSQNHRCLYLLIFFAILIMASWNFVWVMNYNEYSKLSIGYEKSKECMGKKVESYYLSLKLPTYFSFTGNFVVSHENIDLIIWPDLFINGDCTYGLKIFDEKVNHGFMLYVDQEMNYSNNSSNKFSKDEVKIIKELLSNNVSAQ